MKKKKNSIAKFLTNIYVKNFLLIIATFLGIVVIVLIGLNFYTKHNESIAVPPLKGLQVSDAASILSSSDLKYEVIDSIYRADGVPGAIIDQVPQEKSNVKRGRTVFLIVQSKNTQMIQIPELRDFSRRSAEAQLRSLGFNNIMVSEVASQYKGLVLSVEYKGQTLLAGQKIPKGAPIRMIVGAGGEAYQDSIDTPDTEIEKPFFE